VNDTTVTCATPAADTLEAPFVDVSVTNSLGTATLDHPFCYATALLTESFSGSSFPAWLEDRAGTYTVSGGTAHDVGTGNNQDRRYVRTVAGDFVGKDFVYEVTIRAGLDYAVFPGIGTGDPDFADFTEPYQTVHLRLHGTNVASPAGRIDITTTGSQSFTTLGSDTSAKRRFRLLKLGPRATFAHHGTYVALSPFTPELSFAYADLAASATYLDGTSSHLVFGGGAPTFSWDDVVVATLRTSSVRVASLSAATSAPGGGATLTITGSGFNGLGASPVVRFGTTAVTTGISVGNDTTLTVSVPAHAAGVVDVVVRGATGSGILLRSFTYQ
jgi:hypothetical protein